MQRVGTVVRTAQGKAIARSPNEATPALGAIVVDESLDRVGRVVDVFGPVSQPYVLIDPSDTSRVTALLNQRVYVQ